MVGGRVKMVTHSDSHIKLCGIYSEFHNEVEGEEGDDRSLKTVH